MAMDIEVTRLYGKMEIASRTNRYLIFKGGSSSSKTITILQWLTVYAFKHSNKRIVLSAESTPVIKKTLLADWKQIVMKDMFDINYFNLTDMTYTFPTGSKFMFVPGDMPERWHGMRQDITMFDEIYHIKKSIFDQADIRTKDFVIASFNPVSKFWIADMFDEPNVYVNNSTFKDNPFLEPQIIDALRRRMKTDKNFWRVYGLGEWGSLEGLVFKEGTNWSITTDWPDDFKSEVYALDFGYSVDPAALLHIRYHNGELWIKEVLYKLNMTNPDIFKYLEGHTVADSAEPKSIEELRRLGADIKPSMKGKDSINAGISLLKQFKVNVHVGSLNLIKELRNYTWDENRQGETLTKPIDNWNDCIDAARYGAFELFNKKNVFFI